MKRKHAGDIRGYSLLSEAYYGKGILSMGVVVDEVTIGMYCPDGGTSGEFCVQWVVLCGKVTPQLTAFDDSWSALAMFSDVMAKMAKVDSDDISPKQFCALLDSCGVVDRTPRGL